jgi:ammonium transporter Rh
MIFVGFGFLMVFLKTNCWSGVGFNFLIACWAIQINILMLRFWEMALIDNRFVKIELNLTTLISADYGAAACLITFGAIMGKCSFSQIFILATLEMIFYSLNVTVCKGIL